MLLQCTTASAVSGVCVLFTALYPTPECVVAVTSEEFAEQITPLGLAKRATSGVTPNPCWRDTAEKCLNVGATAWTYTGEDNTPRTPPPFMCSGTTPRR